MAVINEQVRVTDSTTDEGEEIIVQLLEIEMVGPFSACLTGVWCEYTVVGEGHATKFGYSCVVFEGKEKVRLHVTPPWLLLPVTNHVEICLVFRKVGNEVAGGNEGCLESIGAGIGEVDGG